MHIRYSTDKRGFTLIEMIAALAITAVFLTALSFHLVGISTIWINGVDDDFFDQHVEGVTLFLQNSIDSATAPKAEAGSQSAAGAVSWSQPPASSQVDPELIHFRLAEAPPLLVREGARLPAIQAWLQWSSRSGLSIIWTSELEAEEIDFVNDLRNSLVTPYVTKFEYAYYDDDREEWETREDPLEENTNPVLPQAIILTFEYEAETRQRTLYLPRENVDLPLF